MNKVYIEYSFIKRVKKTLILDLDETLIHSELYPSKNNEFGIKVTADDKK